jgi:hypothetical protein
MNAIHEAFERGEGIFRLAPNWVAHNFNRSGGRLRLHPDDYFAFGVARGSIKERWFCSTIAIGNGSTIPADAGLSYVAPTENLADRFLFRDALAELGAALVGGELMARYGGWPMYAKFFDYAEPLFHHLHLDDVAAARIGHLGKPEAYYFPPQLNDHLGEFPLTYFGFDPDVTREMVRERLAGWNLRDTRITELSRAYRIELGTGWYTPPGVAHAPGSVLTYEPQWNSNVGSVWENVTSGEIFPYGSLVSRVPDDYKQDMDYIMSLLDWEANVDAHYRKHYFRPPVFARAGEGYTEKWISYANPYVGAKELTILPGHTVTMQDAVAHGCIIIQGHGSFGVYDAEAPIMLRFGQLSADEYFVSEAASRAGIVIHNASRREPMVILKHFGPNHPDMPQEVV